MHLLGADLHLDRHAIRTDQVGMDRLVAVPFRNRNVVLELARNRLVERVQCAEREVTRRHVLHDDAAAEDVVHLGERQMLLDHLAVGQIHMLLASENLR